MCKHAEKENNLHDQIGIMFESMDNTKVRQKKPLV